MRDKGLILCSAVGLLLGFTGVISARLEPYLGQEPPGITPKLFAPDIVSLSDQQEHSITFTPDGNECYYSVYQPGWPSCWIMQTTYRDGAWTVPRMASFSNHFSFAPSVSPDGERIFFCSRRGTAGGQGVWQSTRMEEGGWSEPVELVRQISSPANEASCHLSDLGNMFVCSWRGGGRGGCDAWRIPSLEGAFQTAENLAVLNTISGDCGPCPGPNEAYIVLQSSRPSASGSAFSGADLYFSLARPEGGWMSPRNLGLAINSPQTDIAAWISFDGRYLFFSSTRNRSSDIFWVETRAFLPDPNGTIENVTSEQRFSSVQAAITHAQLGATIVIEPGVYSESVVLDKDITLRSQDPNDPNCVEKTILVGDANEAVLTLTRNSSACTVAGLTLRAGAVGILGTATHATIEHCRIVDHSVHGVELSEVSQPHLKHCLIAHNGQTGITMHSLGGGRRGQDCKPVIENCTIIDNGQAGLVGGKPAIIDSVIQEDSL